MDGHRRISNSSRISFSENQSESIQLNKLATILNRSNALERLLRERKNVKNYIPIFEKKKNDVDDTFSPSLSLRSFKLDSRQTKPNRLFRNQNVSIPFLDRKIVFITALRKNVTVSIRIQNQTPILTNSKRSIGYRFERYCSLQKKKKKDLGW